ncbi:MAG TPA: response regulator [Gemmatimonadaceae bacterium]|nr:response regulator [Gemmatimonadaceae bacterium]
MSRILVVDDDPAARTMIVAALVTAGHDVVEATDAHGALREVLSRRPDAAVVDIVLPSFSGVDVTRAIHGVTGAEQLPIVAVTGHRSGDALLDPETFGARCLLRKPFTDRQIVDAVEGCLG